MNIETFIAVAVGLGLAASCGLRVFLPLLVLGVSANAGMVELGEGTAWIGSWPALVALGTGAVIEVAGYWIPYVDHGLDAVAAPAALIAGTLVAASQWTELDPLLRWSAALIAGGGVAGIVQTATMGLRAVSTATTGGVANPLVSTAESAGAFSLSAASILAPPLAVIGLVIVAALVIRALFRRKNLKARLGPA